MNTEHVSVVYSFYKSELKFRRGQFYQWKRIADPMLIMNPIRFMLIMNPIRCMHADPMLIMNPIRLRGCMISIKVYRPRQVDARYSANSNTAETLLKM